MWFVLLLLALNWPVGLSNDPDLPYNSAKLSIPNRELCWERCFQVEDEDTERFREIYDDFYKMGMEARRLKNMYGVNGTAILLDSTLSTANLVDINNGNGPPDMRFAVPNYNAPLPGESTADEVWEFQRNLASILMMVLGSDDTHNPIFMSQFDENGASTCEEFHCLHSCEADYILDTELDNPDHWSFGDGSIEVACHLSKKFITTTPCEAKVNNEMAISFLNSGINFKKSLHESTDVSSSEENTMKLLGKAPCIDHFNTRMAIGTHMAKWEDLDKWSSKAARPFYFHDSRITRAASASLRQCLRTRCCPIDATYYIQGITGNVCKVSNQENGYDIVNFYGHSANGS